jgi:hypothetical protein
MFVFVIAITLLFDRAGAAAEKKPYTLSPCRFAYTHDSKTVYFPYASSHDINEPNTDIDRILIVIHGSDPISDSYLKRAQKAATPIAGQTKRTLIIAPQFLQEKHVKEFSCSDNLLYWRVSPYWGDEGAYCKQHGDMSISPFSILDALIKKVAKKILFPELKSIVVFGHSGGGQMVNRYAAISPAEDIYVKPLNISMRYVVSSPSSYLYFNEKRWVQGTRYEFAVPNDKCEEFNDYGFGLSNLYRYHKDNGSAEAMLERYPARNVVYLIGEKDISTTDPSLSKTCGSMLQGKQRMERGQVYYAYLKDCFGSQITKTHSFAVVPESEHNSATIMDSTPGRKYLFDR